MLGLGEKVLLVVQWADLHCTCTYTTLALPTEKMFCLTCSLGDKHIFSFELAVGQKNPLHMWYWFLFLKFLDKVSILWQRRVLNLLLCCLQIEKSSGGVGDISLMLNNLVPICKCLEKEYLEFISIQIYTYLYVYYMGLWQNPLEYSAKLYYLIDL